MTTNIKCACDSPDCKLRIEIGKDNYLGVYDQEGKATYVRIPPPVAKAIRDAVKAMEDNHDH